MIVDKQQTPILTGRTVLPAALTNGERLRMLNILETYFNGVTRAAFEKDLNEKDVAILLIEKSTGVIQGFSTQKFISAKIEGRIIQSIFSGDTIVEKKYWHQTVLVKEWFKLVFKRLDDQPEIPLYWFLICMGYKTYRFLPVYFKTFYPSRQETDDSTERKILDVLAHERFNSQYDASQGVIRFKHDRMRLRSDFAEVPYGKKINRHVQLFLNKNPGYRDGDELACLVRLHPSNFQETVHRFTKCSHILNQPIINNSGKVVSL